MKRSLKLLWIIVAACALCACAGSGSTGAQRTEKEFDALRAAVTKEVPEPDRQARALAAVDGLQEAARNFTTRLGEFQADIERLNADPATSRDMFAAAFHQFNGERDALRRKVVSAHLVLLAEVGAGTWPQVSGREQKALIAAMSTQAGK